MKLTLDEIEKWDPCEEGWDFALKCGNIEAIWDTCPNGLWLLWLLEHAPVASDLQCQKIMLAYAEKSYALYSAQDELKPIVAQALAVFKKQVEGEEDVVNFEPYLWNGCSFRVKCICWAIRGCLRSVRWQGTELCYEIKSIAIWTLWALEGRALGGNPERTAALLWLADTVRQIVPKPFENP